MSTRTPSTCIRGNDELGAYIGNLRGSTRSLLAYAIANNAHDAIVSLQRALDVCRDVGRHCSDPPSMELSRVTQIVLRVSKDLSQTPVGGHGTMAQSMSTLIRDYQMFCPLLFKQFAETTMARLGGIVVDCH